MYLPVLTGLWLVLTMLEIDALVIIPNQFNSLLVLTLLSIALFIVTGEYIKKQDAAFEANPCLKDCGIPDSAYDAEPLYDMHRYHYECPNSACGKVYRRIDTAKKVIKKNRVITIIQKEFILLQEMELQQFKTMKSKYLYNQKFGFEDDENKFQRYNQLRPLPAEEDRKEDIIYVNTSEETDLTKRYFKWDGSVLLNLNEREIKKLKPITN